MIHIGKIVVYLQQSSPLSYIRLENWRPLPDERYTPEIEFWVGWDRKRNKNKSSKRGATERRAGKTRCKAIITTLCLLSKMIITVMRAWSFSLVHGVCALYNRPGKTAETVSFCCACICACVYISGMESRQRKRKCKRMDKKNRFYRFHATTAQWSWKQDGVFHFIREIGRECKEISGASW